MYRGSCLCRAVTYEASELLTPYVYCHCQSCRKSSGSAFAANVAAPIEGFKILQGEELLSVFESSPGKDRYFCKTCGSPLFTKVGENPSVVRIRLGSLDSSFSEKRAAHIFAEEKCHWYEMADSAPQFPAWPDPKVLRIPGSRQDDTRQVEAE